MNLRKTYYTLGINSYCLSKERQVIKNYIALVASVEREI